MFDQSLRNSVRNDLQTAQEVLQELSEKATQFGRLQSSDAAKMERVEPDLERAMFLAAENDEKMLERRMEKVLGLFEDVDGRKMRATSQEREKENVEWAREVVETARKEL